MGKHESVRGLAQEEKIRSIMLLNAQCAERKLTKFAAREVTHSIVSRSAWVAEQRNRKALQVNVDTRMASIEALLLTVAKKSELHPNHPQRFFIGDADDPGDKHVHFEQVSGREEVNAVNVRAYSGD